MLHVDVYGDGPELVLLHGWGMHGGLFRSWAQELAETFRIAVVDLPGHGNSSYSGQRDLQEWAEAVLEVAPPQACWVGWSLGGLVALAAAKAAPERCRALVLLASTPRFVSGEDWSCAVDAGVFDQFARQLAADVERTRGRFLALQTRGCENSTETLRCLRAELAGRPSPDPQALRAGLDLLLQCDQREVLRRLEIPLFGIFGERDTLVPAGISTRLRKVQSTIIEGAGHAPFISHGEQCGVQLEHWLLNDPAKRHATN